jgi:hypothetical protein
VDVVNGELDSLILPHVNTDCMQPGHGKGQPVSFISHDMIYLAY